MPDPDFYLREEPVCALDPLLLIPRIEYAQSIFSSILGSSVSYSLVILDMINFHKINDVFGYDVGDSVLLQFISFVRLVLPLGSIAMRFRHGDEFLFFLPISEVHAQLLFDEIRVRSHQVDYPQLAGEKHFNISFRYAVVALDDTRKGHREWLRDAEVRLRAVKGQGTPRHS
jgi:diguanylate cyclase (GGDEF)-like protein